MGELLGIARFRFKEGKRDEYLRLTEQANALVAANEPGTLQYDLFLNDDQTECMIIDISWLLRRSRASVGWPSVYRLTGRDCLNETAAKLPFGPSGADRRGRKGGARRDDNELISITGS